MTCRASLVLMLLTQPLSAASACAGEDEAAVQRYVTSPYFRMDVKKCARTFCTGFEADQDKECCALQCGSETLLQHASPDCMETQKYESLMLEQAQELRCPYLVGDNSQMLMEADVNASRTPHMLAAVVGFAGGMLLTLVAWKMRRAERNVYGYDALIH